MDSKDNNVNDFLSRYGRLIIYIAGFILYIILLWMCLSQMRQSGDVKTRLISKEVIPEMRYIVLPSSINSIDSMAKINSEIARFDTKMDSAIKLINTWNNSCNERERLLRGLDDLRQETNNVIDKQNGWLSFWIAILALVGALVPLLIQMNMQQDLRHEYDKIDKELERLRSNRYYSEISKLSFTLIECSESILRIGDSKRNEYCDDLLNKLHNMTGSFFATITENNSLKNFDMINDLKIVLIQLLAAYNACKALMTQKHRLKDLEKVTTSIGEIIQNLYDENNDKNNIDNQKLTDLLVQMDSIHIA